MGKRSIRRHRISFDTAFDFVNWVLLSAVLLLVLYPLIYIVSASLSEPVAVNGGRMWLLPIGFTLDGYRKIFEYGDILMSYGNTVNYTLVGTFISLCTILMYGYAISRRDLVGRKLFTGVILVTMFFGGGLVPTYIVIRRLGLLDTRAIIYVAGAASAYYIVVCRTFYLSTIPDALREAAIIDGCGNFTLFVRIILPLSRALIVVMILFIGVSRWNWYFWPMILLKTRALFPLQIILKEILIQSQMSASMMTSGMSFVELARQAEIAQLIKYAVIIVSCAPILAVYPFLQRYFEKGVMIGSVKG